MSIPTSSAYSVSIWTPCLVRMGSRLVKRTPGQRQTKSPSGVLNRAQDAHGYVGLGEIKTEDIQGAFGANSDTEVDSHGVG